MIEMLGTTNSIELVTFVAVGELEGLQQAKSFLDRATDLVIVDLHRADLASGVYVSLGIGRNR